jgi:hypothetical protein
MDWCALLKRKLHNATMLPRREWRVLLEAWVMLLAVDAGLRVLSFAALQKCCALVRSRGPKLTPEQAREHVDALQRMTDLAARNYLHSVLCLQRALALQRLLGRRGIRAELRIGVRKEIGQLHAHAWLEYEGQPLAEPASVRSGFTPLLARIAGQ